MRLASTTSIQTTIRPLSIVILGLSIRSSWGNGHATTYRGLVRALAARHHRVLFLERDMPWYARAVDMPQPVGARLELYTSLAELRARFTPAVRDADLVIVGSYTPQGTEVGEWVLRNARGFSAFYDIDTPVTLQALAAGKVEYITNELLRSYDLYLSFTGGPFLSYLTAKGARMARPLYCSADVSCYFPDHQPYRWDLGYMGTYSVDRAAAMQQLVLKPARLLPAARMVIAGPQYPAESTWPANVDRFEHLPPSDHRAFFSSQRFTLNLTREPMKRAGYSPSIRLFEAAASGCAIISDWWPGLDTVFAPGKEILVARDQHDVVRYLTRVSERRRSLIARRARARVLAEHTAEKRVLQLEAYLGELGFSGQTYSQAVAGADS
ncbi:MAG: glycosyltransferase [Deltaproteobacteria bacterium]|nr:glycosyltransferase [Deltaproteobacteria bacterium]